MTDSSSTRREGGLSRSVSVLFLILGNLLVLQFLSFNCNSVFSGNAWWNSISLKTTTPHGHFYWNKSLDEVEALSSVEGDRNETSSPEPPKIAFITYAHLMDRSRFDKFIFPALHTWVPPQEKYYVVLSNLWRSAYDQMCGNIGVNEGMEGGTAEASHDNSSTNEQRYNCERLVPLFVDCPEGYTGEAPCCKQEKGLMHMMDAGHAEQYNWFVYHDDDDYFWTPVLQDFVSRLNSDEQFLILWHGEGWEWTKTLGKTNFMQDPPYNCSKKDKFRYPTGQPTMFSKAALQTCMNGFRLGGIVKQCLEYDVMHDVGNAIFYWMYSLPALRLQIIARPDEHVQQPRSGRIITAVHGISVDNISMLDVHEQYRVMNQPSSQMFDMVWHNVTGYHHTKTFEQHGEPITWTEEWHTMPVADCLGGI